MNIKVNPVSELKKLLCADKYLGGQNHNYNDD